jgi:REP element-mobilizing transposase RayT
MISRAVKEIGFCSCPGVMPNTPRLFVPGISLHVRQRGNNRCAIFGDESDYEWFLVMLQAATKRYRVDVHGYTLMTTHTHLQVTPDTTDGKSEAMKQLGGAYVQYFNKKYQRVGTLWTGRYKGQTDHQRTVLAHVSSVHRTESCARRVGRSARTVSMVKLWRPRTRSPVGLAR